MVLLTESRKEKMYLISLYFLVPFEVAKLQMAESGSTAKAEVQVARMVVVMVLAFLLTWLPYAALALTVIFDSTIYINPVIATIPTYLTKSSTVFNPIIYIFMNRQVSKNKLAILIYMCHFWKS